MGAVDDLLANNERYAAGFDRGGRDARPARKLAIVACMDSRLDVHGALGLDVGEAHVIRNAGGIVTDDIVRSLSISQRMLGTEEVMLIHHTDCGLLRVTDDEFRDQLEADTGVRPEWSPGAFRDVDESVRESRRKILESPFVEAGGSVRGFVFEIETGRLREVD